MGYGRRKRGLKSARAKTRFLLAGGFDKTHMNESYAIVGQFLQDAVARRGTGPVVYHPSNLGFEFPRQFRELAAIANQWRFFGDVQASWGSLSGIIEDIGAGPSRIICVLKQTLTAKAALAPSRPTAAPTAALALQYHHC